MKIYTGHHDICMDKVQSILDSFERGDYIPPYVVDKKCGTLVSGHHRQQANILLQERGSVKLIPIVEWQDVKDDPQWFEKYGTGNQKGIQNVEV